MKQKPLVSVANVGFKYDDHTVLHDISFDIMPGDYLGIIGPNGSGKTSLVKLMLGLLKPTSGTITIGGLPVSSAKSRKAVAYIPQNASHIDTRFPMSVEEVVKLGLVPSAGFGRWLKKGAQDDITNALELVGMADKKHKLITELSGGQQQRVYIAKALVAKPSLLILDEPTVGIDNTSQDAFYDLLAELNRDTKLTLVMISHDIDVVVNEINKLACINERLIYFGEPKAFMTEAYMAQLYGKARKLIMHGH